MSPRWLALVPLLGLALLAGCVSSFGPRAEHGITFYAPGAGNIDFGDAGVRAGLERAGYRGQVATVMWSVGFNPLTDQIVTPFAKIGAARLASRIETYAQRYPGKPINLVGLSAGSGVAIWALEKLDRNIRVDNVVLMSSSLSYNYDISDALRHVKGKVYNYYSRFDPILQLPMKLAGTIDRRYGVDGAGAVGLKPPRGGERVVNIPWKREYAQYGYSGGHTDVTSAPFVERYVAQYLISGRDFGAETEDESKPRSKRQIASAR